MEAATEEVRDLQDWEVLRRFLPPGWEEQAKKTGALKRARGVEDADTLLRMAMVHLVYGCSLVEAAARAREAGWARISSVALYKRLRGAEQWLRWLAEQVRTEKYGPFPRLERVVRVVDATTISEPGSTGTDWRVHYAVNLANLQCDYFELTDAGGGETAARYPVSRGDVILADRGYASARGIEHVVGQGGDIIVRWRLTRPLLGKQGGPADLLKLTAGLRVGQVRQVELAAPAGDQPIPGRLIIVKRSRPAAERALKRIRDKLRKQRPMSKRVRRAAAYFFLWTSLKESDLAAPRVLEMYRLRWQIELVFKRLKSIMGLGHLPKKDPRSARAWLHGKLLAGLLVERVIDAASSFSPWGYPLEPAAEPMARNRIHVP